VFDQNGLSLDQAPPIAVVLRFFMIGALFGVLGGIWMAWNGSDVLNPASASGRIMTHILTLGVMLSFMLGALFQMLPVIAGVTLQAPLRLSSAVQIPFVLGIFSLLWGFQAHAAWAFNLAAVLLGIALLPLTILLIGKLIRLTNHSASSRGMSLALLSLGIVVLFGLYLSGTYGGVFDGQAFTQIRTAHYSVGLFGWVALLIVAISFQVVEMFYVTPPHPNWMRKGLGGGLLILLFLGVFGRFWFPTIWDVIDPAVGLLLMLYAGVTLRRFSQRKRPLTDATVWFWRIGLGSLIATAFVLLLSPLYIAAPWLHTLSSILFATFALSILFAMLYKIIPFLTWFHLNAQGYLTAPMMHEVIHPKTAKKHLYIHVVTLVLLLVSILFPSLVHVAGAGLMLSFGWLLYQIIHALSLYRQTQRTGQRFELNP